MDNLATRYAEALYSLALDKSEETLKDYHLEVKEIISLLEENKEFITILNSSFLSMEDRLGKVDAVFRGLDDDVLNFIKVVVKNNRTIYLLDILKEFNSQCNDHFGIGEGILYSAFKLEPKEIKEIEEAFSKKEKRKVELKNRIDTSLIGGIKVVIKDKVYDGSVLSRLRNLKDSLLKGGSTNEH